MNRQWVLTMVALAFFVTLDVVLWLRLATTHSDDEVTAAASGGVPLSATAPATSEAANTSGDGMRSRKGPAAQAEGKITLRKTTPSVGQYETVDIAGRYRGAGAGTELVLQRLDGGGWLDFPLPTVVKASGRFSTLVELAELGPNRLRVIDPQAGVASDVVRITVS